MIIIPGTSLPALSNPGAAGDLKNGKQLIDANGNVLTGTMPTITLPTPGITVSSGGLITVSYEANAGYTSGGSKSGTKQLTTQTSTTITPGTSQKTAVASGRYTTGPVYVAGDSDLKASNIKSGVNIFGVSGSLVSNDYYVLVLERSSSYITPSNETSTVFYYNIDYTAPSFTLPSDLADPDAWDIVAWCVYLSTENGPHGVTYFGTPLTGSNYRWTVDGMMVAAVGGVITLHDTYAEVPISRFAVESTGDTPNGSVKVYGDSFIVIARERQILN